MTSEDNFYLEYTQISREEMLSILKSGFISNIYTSNLTLIIPQEYLKYRKKYIYPYKISPNDTLILFQRVGDRLTKKARKEKLFYRYSFYKIKLIPK